MKLYHGTNSDFDQFSLAYAGTNTDWENCSRGVYLSDEIGMAQLFGTNVLECTINVSKPLNLDDVFGNSTQAPDIVKIIFQEDISDPEEALMYIDENVGLAEIADFKECFNSRETIEEFMALGYDHIIDRFADYKIEYCVFDPLNISILQTDLIHSLKDKDFVKVLPLNSFQKENALKAIKSKNDVQLDFVFKQLKKNIDSIPDKIDGYNLDNLAKLNILSGKSSGEGQLTYSIQEGQLFRTLEGMSLVQSPVLKTSVEQAPKRVVRLSI